MIKLLYFGDPHIRGTSPRNRLDDYKEALKAKLREVFYLAEKHQVQAIVQPGDTFDRPEVSTAVLLEFADLLSTSPVPIYTTVGNHDVYGYNLETLGRTSLEILRRLVPQLHVLRYPNQAVYFEDGDTVVQLTFTPYSHKIDVEGYGYSPEVSGPQDAVYKIHVAHGMLLDHIPPFDRFTRIYDVETTADMILSGHDHTGYGVFRRPKDGKLFCNPGSLTRLAASQAEVSRPIQAALITVAKSPYGGYKDAITLFPLLCAKPGEEILDRSKIEAEAQRSYAMEQFSTLIQTETGGAELVDLEAIMAEMARLENMAPDVVALAQKKLAEIRGQV